MVPFTSCSRKALTRSIKIPKINEYLQFLFCRIRDKRNVRLEWWWTVKSEPSTNIYIPSNAQTHWFDLTLQKSKVNGIVRWSVRIHGACAVCAHLRVSNTFWTMVYTSHANQYVSMLKKGLFTTLQYVFIFPKPDSLCNWLEKKMVLSKFQSVPYSTYIRIRLGPTWIDRINSNEEEKNKTIELVVYNDFPTSI